MIRRALIFGASGQLGVELQRIAPAGVTISPLDLGEVDIRDHDAVSRAIAASEPETVFNCAAFTNVDGAESAPDDAMATNGVAPGIIAAVCAQSAARLLHISTDYVFDGRANVPYPTGAPTSPLNVYGASKLEGERRVLTATARAAVVRTAWLHSGTGVNFVKTAVRVLGSGSPMRVVDDQIGTPTRAQHLAHALWNLAARPDVTGILHFTDAGVASWYDVAVAVMDAMRSAGRLATGASVEAISSSERPSVTRRPAYSVLDKHESWRAIGFIPPHWREGVIASTQEILNA